MPINYRTTLKFCIVSVNFERRNKKRAGGKKVLPVTNRANTYHMRRQKKRT
jgi:hypothetical protein